MAIEISITIINPLDRSAVYAKNLTVNLVILPTLANNVTMAMFGLPV